MGHLSLTNTHTCCQVWPNPLEHSQTFAESYGLFLCIQAARLLQWLHGGCDHQNPLWVASDQVRPSFSSAGLPADPHWDPRACRVGTYTGRAGNCAGHDVGAVPCTEWWPVSLGVTIKRTAAHSGAQSISLLISDPPVQLSFLPREHGCLDRRGHFP
jgi:hypothetical protein